MSSLFLSPFDLLGRVTRKLIAHASIATVLALSAAGSGMVQGAGTVKVGILHSLTGTMAISETSLHDVELMAIHEINAKGGVLGKKIDPVVVNPASNWDLFAQDANTLIEKDKVKVIFGCWTSVSRKSVLPVVQADHGLLVYPVQYEGEEYSPNIFYIGAVPNQQLIPSVKYLMSKAGGKCKRFFLLGSDYVFPRTANEIMEGYLLSHGVPKSHIKVMYVPLGYTDFQTVVSKIKAFSQAGRACVLSTLNGSSNVPFYTEFANQGLTAESCPIMAYSIAEDELRSMDTTKLVGHYACWNYFQSLRSKANKKFVHDFKMWCMSNHLPGGMNRVTDDPIDCAYVGVYLWAAACEKAKSFNPMKVAKAMIGLKMMTPGGMVKVAKNHNLFKPVYVGKILANGQFRIVWRSKGWVKPVAFSPYIKVAMKDMGK
jgi:urea transport system substrate-binding protein